MSRPDALARTQEVACEHRRHLFQRDSQAAVVFPYALSDVTPPGRPNKRIDTAVDVPACTSAPRPNALIQPIIDNVFVNQSAAP